MDRVQQLIMIPQLYLMIFKIVHTVEFHVYTLSVTLTSNHQL